MNITVNGEAKSFSSTTMTITAVLKESKVENPQLVTVQHNGNFVDQQNYTTVTVNDKDEIDFLYFLGGGQ